MNRLSDLRTVHIEASSKCNARCPMCSRYTSTGFIQPGLKEVNLEPEIFYKFFTPEIVSNLDEVYISGVYGDPCMNIHLVEYAKFFKDNKINIVIDTNGGYRNAKWWTELAQTGAKVNFTIDGFKESNEIYRRNVVWEIVEKNIRAFSIAGGKGIWNFIVFEHNEHDIDAAMQLSTVLGFKFNTKVTQKFRGKKEWKVIEDGNHLYTINPPRAQHLRHPNVGIADHIIVPPKFKFEFTRAYERTPINEIRCQTQNRKELYLTSTGLVLPCCWLGTYEHDGMWTDQFKSLHSLNKFDLHLHSLEEVFNSQFDIYSSFDKPFGKGRILACNNICDVKAQQIVLYHNKETNKLTDFPKVSDDK